MTWRTTMNPGVVRTLILGAVLAFASQHAAAATTKDEVVWTWYGNCPAGQVLRVRALLDDKVVHTLDVPICSMRRSAIPREREQRILAFRFRAPGRTFADERPAASSTQVEGNIWIAGHDADGITFGVSITDDRAVLLNSLHFASASGPSRSNWGGGFSVETKPAAGRGTNSSPPPSTK